MVGLLFAQDRGAVDASVPASLDSLGAISGFWETEPRTAAHDALQDARCALHGYLYLIDLATLQTAPKQKNRGPCYFQ